MAIVPTRKKTRPPNRPRARWRLRAMKELCRRSSACASSRSTRSSRRAACERLEIFLKVLGPLPGNFAVTLPKVTAPEQVAKLVEIGVPRIEMMIETPQSLFLLPELVAAGNGQ